MSTVSKKISMLCSLFVLACFIVMFVSFVGGAILGLISLFVEEPFSSLRDTAALIFILSFLISAIGNYFSGMSGRSVNWDNIEGSQF